MLNFGISVQKTAALYARMAALGIREEDLEEEFIRSAGKGGQNVNKVASCVRVRHLPSGLEVKCQESRQQLLNRYLARVRLADKLDEKIRGRQSDEQKRIEKIRRQKRKRSKRAKEKMLADKKRHAEKKAGRKMVS